MPDQDDLKVIYKDYLEELHSLEDLLIQGSCVFLIGAGCSKIAGLPLMAELTEAPLFEQSTHPYLDDCGVVIPLYEDFHAVAQKGGFWQYGRIWLFQIRMAALAYAVGLFDACAPCQTPPVFEIAKPHAVAVSLLGRLWNRLGRRWGHFYIIFIGNIVFNGILSYRLFRRLVFL